MLEVALSDADGQMADLVARAEAGEDVVLTRDGRAAVRLTPVMVPSETDREALRRALDAIQARARALPPSPGPDAARSQDFLYDEFGLPA